tara:strand:- start:2424 stop:2702 length:279 start_codon:yes stop_codon:yes gene_type:complete
MNKKGSAGYVVTIILLVAVITVGLMINYSNKECTSNTECAQDAYCGSDFLCHSFPDKLVVKQSKNNFLPASIIIGASILAAAIIFKKREIVN